MLSLTLNGKLIPVPSDFSMRLTWKSPLCDFDKIPQSFGLGINIPINEFTRSIFGHPERFSKRRITNDQKFPGFETRFKGVLLMAGTLTITGSKGGMYQGNLIDQVGIMGEKEQERDILETQKFAEPIAWENLTNYDNATKPYCCFPLRNVGFFKDKGIVVKREHDVVDSEDPNKTTSEIYDVEVLSVCFYNTAGYVVNALEADGTIKEKQSGVDLSVTVQKRNTYESSEVTVISPFFFLNYVIKTALKENGFHINSDRNFLEESDIKKLCIYNNFDITRTDFGLISEDYEYLNPHSQDEVYDPEKKLRGVDSYDSIDNKKRDEYITLSKKVWKYNRSYTNQVYPKKHLPKIKKGDLILSTQNLLNVCFHFLPNNTINVLSRDGVLAGPSIDLDKYFIGDWGIGDKKDVTLKFVWAHDGNDSIFAEQFVDLSDRKDDVGEPVDNWGDLAFIPSPKEGEIRFLKQLNIFCEYKWTTNVLNENATKADEATEVLGWNKISVGFQNGWYNYGREIEEIKTSWSTCYGRYFDIVMANRGISVDQAGNMDSWKAKQQSFSPRLLIYNGNNDGGNENPDFALDWEKSNTGILAKYWKLWNQFWANRLPVSGEFDLPVNQLRDVIYNICSKFRTKEGEFVIDEMSCEIYVDRIGTTEINGYKVE